MNRRLKIAHLSGPTATIQNSPPLVTSNKARRKHGLQPLTGDTSEEMKYDALRPQRLAAPAKVYVEQFSAHPLEADADDLYAAPDGYLDEAGRFFETRRSPHDRPVYEIELLPEDGLYPLPYMARQSDGSPWEEECAFAGAPAEKARQGFYPDGSRVFEEIDRLAVNAEGKASTISNMASISFFRVMPPAGFVKGLSSDKRRDQGEGDIVPETRGQDFFPYKPRNLSAQPPRPALARLTNRVHGILTQGDFDGAIWTQGSPNIEDTVYWFNLLIDTTIPIAGNAAQRPHGEISADGSRNIVDSISYIKSRAWADQNGCNRFGTVLVQDQLIHAARDVVKGDARPGGYVVTGGMGGIVGQLGHKSRCFVKYVPDYKHTFRSDVRLTVLPETTRAVARDQGRLSYVDVPIKTREGLLHEDAIPSVSIVKDGGYCGMEWDASSEHEVDLIALIDHKLSLKRLTGLVAEGTTPTGNMTSSARLRLIVRAAFCGIPAVRVGRGAPNGFADDHPFLIAGSNLTSTKARLLLMACLMRFGSGPIAADPDNPTDAEKSALSKYVRQYQDVFDTH